jgi:GTPase SAR1 family protein
VTYFIWDTAGQEEYKALTRNYYRGSGAAIVAFSTTDYDSFLSVAEWVMTVREESGMIPILLVETKQDLRYECTPVDPIESQKLAKSLGLKLYQVSSKLGHNVLEVFEQIAVEFVKRRQLVGAQLDLPVHRIVDLCAHTHTPRTNTKEQPKVVLNRAVPNTDKKSTNTCRTVYI